MSRKASPESLNEFADGANALLPRGRSVVERQAPLQWLSLFRRLARWLRLRNRYNAFLVAVFAALSVVYITMDIPPVYTASPLAHGDGVYYFVYLRSLVYDGDLDFANDYPIIGNQSGLGRNPKTGHYETGMPIGVAILQLPLGFVARAVVPLARWLGLTGCRTAVCQETRPDVFSQGSL